MIRAGLVLTVNPQQPVVQLSDPMHVAALISNYSLATGRDKVLSELTSPGFIPTLRVILESEPAIRPAGSIDPGTVSVSNVTADSLEVTADVKSPAILLITNNFSKGWRVMPLETSGQREYQIMPGNWTLQAIPLAAGKHHLRIEYAPAAFRIGAWISGISLLFYLAAIALQIRSSRRSTTARNVPLV